MALPIDPASMASLSNTLGPAGILSILQSQQEQQQKEMAQKVSEATNAANEAGTQYQNAAAQPAPDLSPGEQFIPSLFGHIAAGIAQDKSYVDRAHAHIAGQQQALREHRIQNLQALKDNYDRKAAHAESVGNHADSEAARLKSESMAKTLQVMLHEDTQSHLNSRNAANIQSREKLAREKPATGAAGRPLYKIANMIKTTSTGKKFVDLGGLVGNARNDATYAANEAGLPALLGADARAVKDIARARKDVTSMETSVNKLAPWTPQNRILGAVGRAVGTKSQTDPQRAAYKVWRDTAIPLLRAMVSGTGLRVTDTQLKVMIDNLPKEDDTKDTVVQKLSILRTVLDNAEGPLLDSDWRDIPVSAAGDPKDPAGIL